MRGIGDSFGHSAVLIFIVKLNNNRRPTTKNYPIFYVQAYAVKQHVRLQNLFLAYSLIFKNEKSLSDPHAVCVSLNNTHPLFTCECLKQSV